MGKALESIPGQLKDIAQGLFKVTSRTGDELVGLCPVHEDKHPSFSYNTAKDVCNCYACGFSGDIIALWCKVNAYGDEKEGFKAFCNAYGMACGGGFFPGPAKAEAPPPLDEAFATLGPLPDAWLGKLQSDRGWSPGAMAFLQIRQQTYCQAKDSGQLKRIVTPDRVAIPVFDDAGRVRNIRLYLPGQQKRDKNGSKIPKIISWGRKYGAARLFPPAPRENGTVLLCEGEPDTICAISQGFNAITQTSKPRKWPKAHLEKFRDRDVVIALDADQPGQKYASAFAAPEISRVARSVRILEWPDFMGKQRDGLWPEDHGQDLTDFFVTHKKRPSDLQVLMDSARHYAPSDEDATPRALEFFKRGVNDRLSFKPRLLANRLMEMARMLYAPDTGLLYKWNGRFWAAYPDKYLQRDAIRLLGDESKQSWAQDAVFQVTALAAIPHGRTLNDREEWICVQNGMLNIGGVIQGDDKENPFELVPHAPEFYASYELGVVFNPDADTRCLRWIRYLQETVQTPEVILQVQEFFGYCLYKRSPFAKCLLLLGPGSDGKSILLNILQEMIGAESCASISFDEMEDQFLRSSLYQKSVNVCGEVGSKVIESTYFKAVTAGDRVNAAFKHKNTFVFKPYCKVLFSGNKMPRVKDTSDGLYRRLLPVQFKRQFKEGDPETDPFLESELKKELSDIFLWSLAGLARLMKNKQFTRCDETERIMLNYKRLNNPVLCFVQDECELDQGAQTPKKDIFKRYESYCRDSNNHPYSRENFYRELYAAFDTLKTTRPSRDNPTREYYLKGLRLSGGSIE